MGLRASPATVQQYLLLYGAAPKCRGQGQRLRLREGNEPACRQEDNEPPTIMRGWRYGEANEGVLQS
jgi:hypothetical protein